MNFDDFFSGAPLGTPGLAVNEVSGTFQCQQCSLYATKATHIPKKHMLIWTCEDGHESEMEWE